MRTSEPPRVDPRRYRDVLGRFATGVTIVTTGERATHVPGGEDLAQSDTTGGAGAGPAANGAAASDDDIRPWGTTVNAFAAVSLDPPLVLVCVGRGRSIHPVIARTGHFAVNILGEDSQGLSDCFAGAPSALPRSAFCSAAYRPGVTGAPLLDAAIAHLECELDRAIDAGDHTMYLGRVVSLGGERDGSLPLLYFHRRYLRIERAAESDLLGIPDV
jgi:flavin reductase (DIM6/NTAB) family NADH-FMN oxidoreductase RutF